jgi:hypothetical protein
VYRIKGLTSENLKVYNGKLCIVFRVLLKEGRATVRLFKDEAAAAKGIAGSSPEDQVMKLKFEKLEYVSGDKEALREKSSRESSRSARDRDRERELRPTREWEPSRSSRDLKKEESMCFYCRSVLLQYLNMLLLLK